MKTKNVPRRSGPMTAATARPQSLSPQPQLERGSLALLKTKDILIDTLEDYARLYEFAPAAYYTLAPDGIIHLVNQMGAQLAGVGRKELVGKLFSALVVPEQKRVFNTFLKKVFAYSSKQTSDFKLRGKGSQVRIINLEAQRSSDGRECRVLAINVTERQEHEDKVRISEIRYRRLFEAAHDGVLLVDPETRKIIDANPFMSSLLSCTNKHLIGKELFEIGLLKDEAASREMFRKLKRNHQVRYENLPLVNRQGRHQEVEVVANLYQENGRPVIQCNIRDITERKQAELILRRSEALFSALVTQSPVGVYVVDSRFCLVQINPKALPQFSRIKPLLKRDFSEIIHLLWPKKVADLLEKRFRHTLKTGAPYQSLNFVEKRKDTGIKEYYIWQIQRVTLPHGEHGVVCFFNNITDHKQAESAQRRLDVLTASNKKLEKEIGQRLLAEKHLLKSKQDQSRMLVQSRNMQEQLRHLSRQILSAQEEERKQISRELHDIIAQTLTSINIRLATLKQEAATNTKGLDRNIALTQKLVEKSVNIVHRYARELRPAVLDDLGLIPALHGFLTNFTTQTGVRTHLTAYSGVEKLGNAQRTVLYRVAQEALTNVDRHAHASRVDVLIQKQPDAVRMIIRDNGKSFPVQRVLNARNNKRLGLLGMRERLEMVGGNLEIESLPGKGTSINARIPFPKVPQSKPSIKS
jgi:PAS domain S-box-containing protein